MVTLQQAIDRLQQFLQVHFPDHQEGFHQLMQVAKVRRFAKNQLLRQAGEQEREIRFLLSGSVRVFYEQPIQSTNIHFYVRPQFIGDMYAFLYQTPTRQAQQALTDVEVLCVDSSYHQQLTQQFPCGKHLLEKLFVQLHEEQVAREYHYRTQSTETLYQYLLDQRPDWLEHLPQYHIASYLGVTPETLSRIRRRIS